jgi:hypothetical protein
LWFIKKTKPVFKQADAHAGGWISAMDNIKQTNVFATGACDKKLKIWGIEGELKGINVIKEI